MELDAGGRVPVVGTDDLATGLTLAAVYRRHVCACPKRVAELLAIEFMTDRLERSDGDCH